MIGYPPMPVSSFEEAIMEVTYDALKKRVTKLERLVQCLIDEDPYDMAADGVTVLEVWRKEAREALGGK